MRSSLRFPSGSTGKAKAWLETSSAATGASLCTDIADPVERLAAIHASMQSAKAMQASLGDDIVIDTLSASAGRDQAGLGLYRGFGLAATHPPIFNAIISNVAGPPVPLFSVAPASPRSTRSGHSSWAAGSTSRS